MDINWSCRYLHVLSRKDIAHVVEYIRKHVKLLDSVSQKDIIDNGMLSFPKA